MLFDQVGFDTFRNICDHDCLGRVIAGLVGEQTGEVPQNKRHYDGINDCKNGV